MRHYLNLLLSIVLPISVLFVIAATFYFSLSYDLGKALKLGTIAGVLTGVGFSTIMAAILLILRKVRTKHIEITHPESHIIHEPSNGAIDKKLMLLMDKELAFEVAIHSIIDQNIGKVTKGSKRQGTISIHTPEQIIHIAISSLTRHTSKIELKAAAYNNKVEQIINYIKLKENSFLQY
jgi:hypothetical protein